jgi:D-beta-D-heptose 7-phosphate kinase/D-beta-D-heptose 1-phosphate adenosyltransferase
MNIDRFGACRVLVVGDVMLDHYVRGTVSRISPEAPVLVLQVQDQNSAIGGAGNVAANVASLGGTAVLVGLVGDDPAGITLQAMGTAGIGTIEKRLYCQPGYRTIEKTRFLAHETHLLRADCEGSSVDPHAEAHIIDHIEECAEGCHAIIVSDYAKGMITATMIRALVDIAGRRGIPIVADPKRPDFSFYRGCAVLTPNRRELAAASGMEADSDEGIAAGMAIAMEQFRGTIVLTRSEHGISLFRRGMLPVHEPARTRLALDVSGAGDTVIAALTLALAAGEDLETAMTIGNAAAAIAVSKTGTATVTPTELAAEMLLDSFPSPQLEKLSTLSVACAQREAWRRQKLTVGFTNGCFDLLHPGHVKLLKAAKAQCDRLVVALNTDASVRRLKGSERPLQMESARAIVISALDAVDAILLFDDDTPMELIAALRPDVIFKGGDYTPETVVGGSLVESYGGRVVLVDFETNQSTTGLIERARNHQPSIGYSEAVH